MVIFSLQPFFKGDEMFSHYIYNGKERLRCGFTTGTCAALAVRAACLNYFGEFCRFPEIMTPKGIIVKAEAFNQERGIAFATASVIKDAGDDIDATDKLEICVRVDFTEDNGIVIDGGKGVGRVTKKGLKQEVGEAAINPVPRKMMEEEALKVFRKYGYTRGAKITVSVPEGEETAKKTFNPHIGIEGGISILGSTGIVEPKSLSALKDSVFLEMDVIKNEGHRDLVLTPGNYGELFIDERYKRLREATVKCSNFIGESLDHASVSGFENVLLIGHIGKFCKLSLGIMDTHSKVADGRKEAFVCFASLAGAGRETLKKLMASITSIECLEILEEAGLKEKTLSAMVKSSQSYLERRAMGDFNVGLITFDNENNIIGQSENVPEILKCFEE